MALDWSNGIGPSFQDSHVIEKMPHPFYDVCYFPEKYPIKEEFPYLINPKKFISLQMSGVDPNETNIVDIITDYSEISMVAINFITFERLFLTDIKTLRNKILNNLDTQYAKLEKHICPILIDIEKKHGEYLNLLERLTKEGPKKFNTNFVHFFLAAAGSEILPVHKRYIDQFLKAEQAAMNFSYNKALEYQELLKGRTLIQIFRSPIEWQNFAMKTSRDLIRLLPSDSIYIIELERFAARNELLANTSDYIPTLEKLSRQFATEPFQIVVPGRRIIKQGVCQKHCRKDESERTLILFNDILLYAKNKAGFYISPKYFDLSYAKVEDTEIPNCFILLTKKKSFVMQFESQELMNDWKKEINDAIQNVLENSGIDINRVKFAPVWIPDKLVSKCMQCNCSFSVVRRRHHCRGCGRVLCGDCLKYKVVLPNISKDPVKVCERCYNTYK